MQLTPEQREIGTRNFNEAVAFSRRDLLKGAAAATTGLGALYFGYGKLDGSRVKTAFIGTGDEGSILINEHPADYMEIVAVCDIRPTNLKRAKTGDGNAVRRGLDAILGEATSSKIEEFDDLRKLLEAKDRLGLEAVVIAVPLNQHAPLAIACMNAGLHVLCEKLMAHNIRECKEMIRVQREQKVLLAVGHQRHYSVLYDNANALVQLGLLGDVKHIRAQWHRNNSFPGRDSWRKDIGSTRRSYLEDEKALGDKVKEFGYDSTLQLVNWRLFNSTGGGLMAELGSHQLDAASIFLGKVKPIAVQGYGGKNFYGVKGIGSEDQQNDPREIDDHVYVTLEFPGPHYAADENDVVIVTYSSINTNRSEPYGEVVYGSRGTLMMREEQEANLSKEASPDSGPGGWEQRLYVIDNQKSGGPVLTASASLAPSQQIKSEVTGKVSRGYTEEMEHFCHCVRTKNFGPREEGGLRCNGVVAMADAIMALTSNLAMKHKQRIVFKPEWFDPDSPAVPEEDEQVKGSLA
ncbi:MAG: Gfo/Idh/MocA family oxidoreductase [Planctomycetales bacterium]